MARHVETDRKSGILSYRRVYPAPLRPFLPKHAVELKRSLRSRSLSDPEAARRYAGFQAEYERNVAMARKAAAGIFDALDCALIDFLAEAFTAEALETDDSARWDTSERELYTSLAGQSGVQGNFAGDERTRWAEKRRETLEASVAHSRSLLGAGDLVGIRELWAWEAEQFCLSRDLRVNIGSPEFSTLCRRLCEASLQAAEAALDRLRGETVPTPAEPNRPLSQGESSATAKQSYSETLNGIAERVMSSPLAPVSRNTRESWGTSLRLWKDVHGDLGWQAITRAHVSEWLDLVSRRPSRVNKRDDDLPLRELLALYADKKGVKLLAGRTIHKHAANLSAIWNKAIGRGWIVDKESPFKRHEIRQTNRTGGNPLTASELAALFKLPIFTEGERPIRGRGEAAFWIPLFALCTGARPAEIAQLLVSDFCETGGRWIMRYTDEGEHPASGPRRLKTSEHGTGRRTFPVPQPLIDLGLPRYLKWLTDSGEAALFPKLTASSKGLYRVWGDWWSKYVREHGVIGEGKRPLREFRHLFPTQARLHRVPEHAVGYILGHSDRTMTSRYGQSEAHGLEILRITNFGTPLDHIPAWEPPETT